MHILPMLSTLGVLMSKEGLKRKGTMGCLMFPFPSMSSFSAEVIDCYREVT